MNGFNNDDNNLDVNLDHNETNKNTYNNILEHSKSKDDQYLDRNNPLVKTILIILFVIALLGTIYYFIMWLKVK